MGTISAAYHAASNVTKKVKEQVYKFKFDLQPGSLTDQVAGEHQPSYRRSRNMYLGRMYGKCVIRAS